MIRLKLDKSKSQPLYVQLEQAILQQIDSGSAGPGDRLPSEREISETLGISRQTVRQTVNQLCPPGSALPPTWEGHVRPARAGQRGEDR